MPVVGLPTAVEAALGSLLTEKSLSSWKIADNGDTTVIVLRLRADADCQQHGDHYDQERPTLHYRRKSPSQLRRDNQRAYHRKQQQQASVTHQASDLNVSASPFEMHKDIGVMGARPMTDTVYNNNTDSSMTPAGTCNTLDLAPVSGVSHSNADSAHETDPHFSVFVDTPPPYTSHVGLSTVNTRNSPGPDFHHETVKHYVGGIFDKRKLDSLRNVQKNNAFEKTSQIEHDGREYVICRSHDIVLVMDCSTYRWKYWLILQQSRYMLDEEKLWLCRLNDGRPVDKGKRLLLTMAEQYLNSLMEMIRSFLG